MVDIPEKIGNYHLYGTHPLRLKPVSDNVSVGTGREGEGVGGLQGMLGVEGLHVQGCFRPDKSLVPAGLRLGVGEGVERGCSKGLTEGACTALRLQFLSRTAINLDAFGHMARLYTPFNSSPRPRGRLSFFALFQKAAI